MFKQITSLGGNEWYMILSLLIFVVFFLVVVVIMITMKKEYSDYMKNMPLNDSNDQEISD